MDVRYEPPLPDLSHTVQAPLRLDIGGGRVATIARWNLDGIYPPDRLEGDEGTAQLAIPFQGFEIGFPVKLRRDPETGMMRFVDLDKRAERVLRHFYREIVTGRAVGMDRMIAAMDTPHEPVPMEQTPEEAEAQTRERWPRGARLVAAAAIYALLGYLAYGPIVQPMMQEVQRHLGLTAEQSADLGGLEGLDGLSGLSATPDPLRGLDLSQ